MPERRGGAGDAGIADENVEPAVALMQRSTQPRDALEVGEIKRHQGRSSAVVADLVVEFFQPSLRSRHRNDMRAGSCKRARSGIADAARGAGDEGDTGGEGKGSHRSNSISASSLRTQGPIRRDGYDAGRRSCLTSFEQLTPGVMGPRVRGDDDLAKQLLDSGFALSARPGMTLRVSSPPPAATIAAAAAHAASCR